MTKSTARYFAKEAYRLATRNGLYQSWYKNRTIFCSVRMSEGVVHVTEGTQVVTCKIAKSWL